jgi:23S rRNA pseudouridine1911/1915/1917 synthase
VTTPFAFTVDSDEAGLRLDRILCRRLPGLGRRRARHLFASGAVRLAGQVVPKGAAARAGDQVVVQLGPPDEAVPDPQAPLQVALETPELVIINKPAGQACAPLSGAERGALANALLHRYPELRTVGYGPREPGLLHRLDTHTSGLVLAARSTPVFEQLRHALRSGRLTKRYLAVVDGTALPDCGAISLPLAPHPTDRRRVAVGGAGGATSAARAAVTRWQVLTRRRGRTLLSIDVAQAYRHQIRAHLAAAGCPILGDRVYGGTLSEALGQRHALHASQIAYPGDVVVPAFAVEAPLPAELQRLVAG